MSVEEQHALSARYERAFQSGELAGYAPKLHKFDVATQASVAVLSITLEKLQNLLAGQAIITFLRQVDSASRLPKADEFEAARPGIEESLFPHYAREINYAALSLDGVGVRHYGPYSLVLKTAMIELRSSMLDENSVLFFRRHHVAAGSSGPPGLPERLAKQE